MATRSRKPPTAPLPTAEAANAEITFDPGPWEYFSSSRVQRARYDRRSETLEVDWVDGGLAYLYSEVPPNVWSNMRRVASPGKFVNRVLNQFPYEPRIDY